MWVHLNATSALGSGYMRPILGGQEVEDGRLGKVSPERTRGRGVRWQPPGLGAALRGRPALLQSPVAPWLLFARRGHR